MLSTQWFSRNTTNASIGASWKPTSFLFVSSHNFEAWPWWSSSSGSLVTFIFGGRLRTKSWAKCLHLTTRKEYQFIYLFIYLFIDAYICALIYIYFIVQILRWINRPYYSFKIFPRFWLAKSTRLIHHNQLLMTKFERILCLTRKWRQKCTVNREDLGTRLSCFGCGNKNGGRFTRFKSKN